jgi:hypothetical protein
MPCIGRSGVAGTKAAGGCKSVVSWFGAGWAAGWVSSGELRNLFQRFVAPLFQRLAWDDEAAKELRSVLKARGEWPDEKKGSS